MAKEVEKPAVDTAGVVAGVPTGEAAGTAAGAPVEPATAVVDAPGSEPSARDRYRGRYSEAYPDLNLDDEEAFYGKANENLDELEGFRESNRQLGEAMDKAPVLAGLVLAAKDGVNPFVYLAENIGEDMDIRELANNPEFAKQMGEALKKFQEKADAAKAKEKEVGENMVKSLQVLKDYQAEQNLSDEEVSKMIADFFGTFDENGKPEGKASFMQNAGDGIVTKGMWEALFNARHYADDVAGAADKARAAALNEKVQNNLRKFDAGVPNLSGGGVGREAKPKPKKGGFASWGEE